jgi:Flp pilus assembly pilin Flp
MDMITRLWLKALTLLEPRSDRGDEGFTIIETMAAAVIGVVLIVATVAPLRTGLTNWVQSIWDKINGA